MPKVLAHHKKGGGLFSPPPKPESTLATSKSAVQLHCQFCNMLALEAGNGQFFLTGLAGTVTAGDGRGTVRRAAIHFRDIKELRNSITQRYQHHAVMGQGGPE